MIKNRKLIILGICIFVTLVGVAIFYSKIRSFTKPSLQTAEEIVQNKEQEIESGFKSGTEHGIKIDIENEKEDNKTENPETENIEAKNIENNKTQKGITFENNDKHKSATGQKGISNKKDKAEENIKANTGGDSQNNEPIILTIKGPGVENEKSFTLSELKNMKSSLATECYSAMNSWPTSKFLVGKGIKLLELLNFAGLKDVANTIIVEADDGYYQVFTKQQLLEKRYYFPNIQNQSNKGSKIVPTIIAWEHREDTKDLSEVRAGKLRLLFGQKNINEVTTQGHVKNVSTIEVLVSSPGKWDKVTAEPAPGKIVPGTPVTLNHPWLDQVKVYYTLDGKTPDTNSNVYNPSTTYYQPQLIKPITISKNTEIKAIVTGLGKYDSEVATFKYEIE